MLSPDIISAARQSAGLPPLPSQPGGTSLADQLGLNNPQPAAQPPKPDIRASLIPGRNQGDIGEAGPDFGHPLDALSRQYQDAISTATEGITSGAKNIGTGGLAGGIKGTAQAGLGAASGAVSAVFAPFTASANAIVPGNNFGSDVGKGAIVGAELGSVIPGAGTAAGAAIGGLFGGGMHVINSVKDYVFKNTNMSDEDKALINNAMNVGLAVLGEKVAEGKSNTGGLNSSLTDVASNMKTNFVGNTEQIAALKTQIQNNVTAGMDKAVESGDIPADSVYTKATPSNMLTTDTSPQTFSPSDTLKPDFANGRIADIAANLNKASPGLGDAFTKSIDPEQTSFAELSAKAGQALDSISRKGIAGTAADVASDVSQKVSDIGNSLKEKLLGNPDEAMAKATADAKEINQKIYDKRASDIKNIENGYVTGRKMNNYANDGGDASRARIANTDVLVNSVDQNGLIRTKQPGGAVDQYRAATLDQAEGVVRNELQREGSKVSLKTIQDAMNAKVKASGLEGADLTRALNGVNKEIAGLRLRADLQGNVPLTVLQDAKINNYKNINFQTPPEEGTARKAMAQAEKETIENTSNLKSPSVKEINAALGNYLQDITRLEALDGKRVEGGRLGKSFSKIGGQAAGAIAGEVIGGPLGAIAGTMIGGEIAARIKGALMASTFGGDTGATITQDPTITQAVNRANSPRLALPAPAEGAPRATQQAPGQIPLPPKAASTVETSEAPVRTGYPTFDQAQAMNEAQASQNQAKAPSSPDIFSDKNTPITNAAKNAIIDTTIQDNPNLSSVKDLPKMIADFRAGKVTEPQLSLKMKYLYPNKEPALVEMIVSHAKALSEFNSLPDDWILEQVDQLPNKKPSSFKQGEIPPTTLPKFGGYSDLTNKTLDALQGKSSVSKAFITDTLKREGVKQSEVDIVNGVLKQYEGQKTIPVQEFADKVKAELLPLRRVAANPDDIEIDSSGMSNRYENITLPPDIRGNVASYSENIYQSPIKTSAGEIHFDGEDSPKNYFGHTRVEDMADGVTRRVIEVQSDLYQKGNLENQGRDIRNVEGKDTTQKLDVREAEVNKLRQYNDPTAHFRMVREEVKQAAIDGKTKLQFPTGETAMKIEGLGDSTVWSLDNATNARPDELKVGKEIFRGSGDTGTDENDAWVITDVLGDGKFKAVPKSVLDDFSKNNGIEVQGTELISYLEHHSSRLIDGATETFDISGKIDTSNPIYKFYDSTLGKYLQKNYGATRITDPKGVQWMQINVPKSAATSPVQARRDTKQRFA